MKQLKAILAAIAAGAATLAGLDLTGFVAVLPAEASKWLVIVPSGAAAVVHFAEAIHAMLNKLEASHTSGFFKLLLIGTALALTLPSCITVSHPDGTKTRTLDPDALKIGGTAIGDIIKSVKGKNETPAPTK